MEDVVRRLKDLSPVINEICRLSGCPGASVGVLHHKQVIFQSGYGFRDVERKLKPDEHTIYYLASLSKSFTAALIGNLVEHNKMKWTTPITKILPKMTHWDSRVRESSNIVDWMSHRTGLAPKNLIWSQEFGHLSMKRKDALPTISYLEKVFDFRTRWLYSNWGYAIADEVITRLSGESWGTILKQQIFDPLSMDRTITDHHTHLDNVAESYMALSDGTPYHLPRPNPEDGRIMEGAVAVQSNVADLLKYYATTLEAIEDQTAHRTTVTMGNPLTNMAMLTKSHIALDAEPSENERSYGLGWIRTQLPGSLGVIGLNPTYIKEMPVVGKGLDRKHLCIYHQGSTNTFLSSVHMLPETHTAIVVLTNSLGNNDTADWLGELLLQTVLNVPKTDQNDYVALAKMSAEVSSSLWPQMARELEEQRVLDTKMRNRQDYVGRYSNVVDTFHLDIIEKDEALYLSFQGDSDALYELKHYNYDVFSWLLTRNEDVLRGRFPVTRSQFYLIHFEMSEADGSIDRLVWWNDPAVPDGETFSKSNLRTMSQEAAASDVSTIEGPN